MLTIKIVAVGKLKEDFFAAACREYEKRLLRFCKLEICQVPEAVFIGEPNAVEIQKICRAEGEHCVKQLQGCVLGLDKGGKQLTSEEFSALLQELSLKNSILTFVIGGSHGHSNALQEKFVHTLSFGKMTYPHQLMRVILLEQLYRAFMIASGSAYHK